MWPSPRKLCQPVFSYVSQTSAPEPFWENGERVALKPDRLSGRRTISTALQKGAMPFSWAPEEEILEEEVSLRGRKTTRGTPMHDDHLWWPVGFALKLGDQALGPLPYAGDGNGFWLGRVRQHPFLLGKAPLRSGHNYGWGQCF